MSEINDNYNSSVLSNNIVNHKVENVYTELEFFKKKCEVMEKDLFKVETINKKNDVTIKKLQDMIAVYGKNTNNTSNSFLLPSEFKSNWETLVKDLIMEAFDSIFDDERLLANLVQDSIRLIYEEANNTIKEKITTVLNSLNIKEQNVEKFLMKFRLLFQEFFSIIFESTKDFYIKIKKSLKSVLTTYSTEILNQREDDINKDIESIGFKTFIDHAFKLCIYMLLHDPQLSVNIPEFDKRSLQYVFFNKTDYMSIEGFSKDKSPCLIILSPPNLRSNFPYQGIKPAVYIISNPSEFIKQECEKNRPNTPKLRSYSSSDLGVINNNIAAENTNNMLTNDDKFLINNESKGNISVKSSIIKKQEHSDNQNNFKNSPRPAVPNKPNSMDLTNINNRNLSQNLKIQNINENDSLKEKVIKIKDTSNAKDEYEELISERSNSANKNSNPISNKLFSTHNNKFYDHSLAQILSNVNQGKNKKLIVFNNNQTNSRKHSNLTTNENENNKDINHKTNSVLIQNNLEPTRNYRSNSHNLKNPSRNSSALESFNNSINKDSLKTNDGVNYQKTSRSNKKILNENNGIDSDRNKELIMNEKLNSASNSFTLIRSKLQSNKDYNITNTINNKGFEKDNKYNENLIRLNLNMNSTKGYHPNNTNNFHNLNEKEQNNKGNNLNQLYNANYPLNKSKQMGNSTNNASTNKYQNTTNTQNYLKNLSNNINLNSMLLKTNYEFNTHKKNIYDLDKYTTKPSKEENIMTTTNTNVIANMNSNNIINESNYESVNKNLKSEFNNNLNMNSNSITNTQSFNRNNSQSSDLRSDSNVNYSTNTRTNGINATSLQNPNNKSKLPSKPNNMFNTNAVSGTNMGTNITNSPKISNPNKIKAMDSMGHGTLSTNSNFNQGKGLTNKPNSHLEYGKKENNQINAAGVMFNGNYDYFGLNQTNTTPTMSDKIMYTKFTHVNNTDSNFTHNRALADHIEGGSCSNRLPTNANIENPNYVTNDMKYNGPKKDDFNLKLSKAREKSKEGNNKPSDVHFNINLNNHNNYIVNKEDSSGLNVNNAKSTDLTKNKLDKYYSKLVPMNNNSPKSLNNFLDNTSNNSNIVSNTSMNNTGKFKENNTYTLNYKEKIMKNSDNKIQKVSYQNFNVSNTFQKGKK